MPTQLFLWLFLVIIYAAVLAIRRVSFSTITANLGLRLGGWRWYVGALGIAVIAVAIALAVIWLGHFSSLIRSPNYAQSYYAAWPLGVSTFFLAFGRELVYMALGEELFFRGLIAGWLFRHLNFHPANVLQALIFLLPHIAILALAGLRFWPLMIPVFIAGWLLGWLRYASGSIFPGILAHGLANAAAAAYVMAAG